MYTSEINKCLANIDNFIGTYPLDKLPKTKRNIFYLIANTDPSYKEGTHWISICIENGQGEYFDPFGIPPIQVEFVNYLQENSNRWCYNTIQIQDSLSQKCGQFCIEYVKSKEKGVSFETFISSFSNKLRMNDQIIRKLHANSCDHI